MAENRLSILRKNSQRKACPKPPLVFILLACASTCLAQAPPQHVLASIAMRDAAALEVSYQLPPSCTSLAFVNDGIAPDTAAELRKDWAPGDDCTLIDGGQLRAARTACTTLRVRVPATQRSLDRIYPWAFPLDDGLYTHTMSFAVTDACGPVDWQFTAPGGTIVADGVVSPSQAERTAAAGGGNYMPVVLLRAAPNNDRLHIAAGFTPQGKMFLTDTLARVEKELRSMLPDVAFTVPYTLATVAADGETWGDVANQTVMRLHLGAAPKPEQQVEMSGFLAHEMAHLTQPVPDRWNDAWSMDGAMLGEGGAEFLRWAITARAGWAQPAEQRKDLERAVTSCVLTAAGGSWRDTRNRGRGIAPYDCGLTFYTLGLAGGKGTARPLLRLDAYYQTARRGTRTDFAQALECGKAPVCTPLWLNRIGGSESVESVLGDYANQPGAFLRVASWTPAMLENVRRRYVNRLMQLDCKGTVHIAYKDDFVRVGAGLHCGALREGMELVSAEGLPLFGQVKGLTASAQACAERGRTALGLKDGTTVAVACDKSAYVPMQLFSVDLDQALMLTK